MARLGLTDLQKSRIESSFQAYRPSLTSAKETLEKEEAQLSRLLDADSIDRSAVSLQVNRVIQARSEMERVNATMTLEMREQLTRAQWAQLQQPNGGRGGRGGGAGPAPPDSFAAQVKQAEANLAASKAQLQQPNGGRGGRGGGAGPAPPDSFAAQVKQAEANLAASKAALARSEAELHQSKLDAERYPAKYAATSPSPLRAR